MLWNNRDKLLALLTILAIVFSGISPACRFIAGKDTLIEICTAAGLKTISVPDGSPAAPGNQGGSHTHSPCPFCLAHAAPFIKADAVPPLRPVLPIRAYTIAAVKDIIPATPVFHQNRSRAPPVFS